MSPKRGGRPARICLPEERQARAMLVGEERVGGREGGL